METAKRIAIRAACAVGILALLALFCVGLNVMRHSFNPFNPYADDDFRRGCVMMLGSFVSLVGFGVTVVAQHFRTWLNKPVMDQLAYTHLGTQDGFELNDQALKRIIELIKEREGERVKPRPYPRGITRPGQ